MGRFGAVLQYLVLQVHLDPGTALKPSTSPQNNDDLDPDWREREREREKDRESEREESGDGASLRDKSESDTD